MLLEGDSKSSAKGEGFDVVKSGNARVVLIGMLYLIQFLKWKNHSLTEHKSF